MTLVEELQRQLETLREDYRRAVNAVHVMGLERSHWFEQATGRPNTHPAAADHRCHCNECEQRWAEHTKNSANSPIR